MSEHTPITGELRAAIAHAERILPLTGDTPPQVRMRLDFLKDKLDAIDAVHANLERENAELRERMAEPSGGDRSIGSATVTVTPRIDWMRMADELDVFTQLVRGFAEQVGEDE